MRRNTHTKVWGRLRPGSPVEDWSAFGIEGRMQLDELGGARLYCLHWPPQAFCRCAAAKYLLSKNRARARSNRMPGRGACGHRNGTMGIFPADCAGSGGPGSALWDHVKILSQKCAPLPPDDVTHLHVHVLSMMPPPLFSLSVTPGPRVLARRLCRDPVKPPNAGRARGLVHHTWA